MAGIYLHIPFCKQICHYCDFYKVGSGKRKDDFVKALLKEIELRKDSLTEPVETIYLGGGTPSVLKPEELNDIISLVKDTYKVNGDVEMTIEVNPDDVSLEFYKEIMDIGFNRLSIGIQSFNEKILKFLNRRHGVDSAFKAIEDAQEAGFKNLSIDLIYGIPSQTILDFISDLSVLFRYRIPHLSAYHLGVEENTYFGKLRKNDRFHEIDEGLSELFFDTLTVWAEDHLFDHYELSNFAFKGNYSKHNRNYWFHVPYLAFGPSAHSYINDTRYHNIPNLNKYIDAVLNDNEFTTVEQLSEINRFNEYVMLRLRTMWGINLGEVAIMFGSDYMSHLLSVYSKFEDSGYIRIQGDQMMLTQEGFFVSDFMFKELFINS